MNQLGRMPPANDRNTQSLQFVGLRAFLAVLFIIDGYDGAVLVKQLGNSHTAFRQAQYDNLLLLIPAWLSHALEHPVQI
ncbi:hypothetical protein D3C81_1737350 [compost metagenome]